MAARSDTRESTLTVVQANVADLTANPRNPRKIKPERMEQLKRALAADPDMLHARPIIALPDGTVIAGNQRLRAAAELGWETIPVVYADLDERRASEWMLRDNRGFGEDDTDLTAALLAELVSLNAELDLTGFSSDEIERLLRVDRANARGMPDASPALPGTEPKSAVGEVYRLGEHVLVCGDANDAAVYEAFGKVGAIITDPPYGIALETDYTKLPVGSTKAWQRAAATRRTYKPVIGDTEQFDAAFLSERYAAVKEQFWFGADYYRSTLPGDDRRGSWLVWDKRVEATDKVIGSGFELIWSKAAHKRDLLRHYWCGSMGMADARDRMHPTQKPISLLAELMTRWTKKGAAVLDPYAGSGSTLIAADAEKRIAYLVEIDPAYCDVIRQRYADYTGQPEYAP